MTDVAAALPRVRIVATGGTVANTKQGRISVDEVLDDIGRLHPNEDPRTIANIDIVDVLRQGAATFTPGDWITIGRAVQAAADDPAVAGVIVTHGTYTAEETAYFLHLTVRTEKPVVVTCSQRVHCLIGNDGDWNLRDAVRVAIADDVAGKGVVLVMNEEIHSARDVTKVSQRPSGFQSRGLGLLGSIEADGVHLYRAPLRRHTHHSEFGVPEDFPRVDIVAAYPGADDTAVRAFLKAGARGIVLQGFAYSGVSHPLQEPCLREAAESGVPVVLVSRGGDGRVPVVNSGPFVRGDNLTAQKARILLGLALTRTIDLNELQRIFNEY